MEETFDVEKYRKENPMDYIKAIEFIKENPTNGDVMKALYDITRLHIPDILYKYYFLSEDCNENNLRFQTLVDKKVYMSDSKSLNDPFDNKAFFYKVESLIDYEVLKKCNGRLIEDFSSFHRLSCFTSNGVNCMPM
ncbi:hypothetical protein [Clostridium sp. 'White wine YQ']|uniref:hypothetical protein n=1 Tax=Clostridium sp. 'White wine YQ' TaxID=3027474 RepID=UPI00236661A4|nr:hypothetical protein [Clostridium sp. 'White wine YQ']MDD7795896.1 hypothetical protein [Clostridium sp. 'White wine YQ']